MVPLIFKFKIIEKYSQFLYKVILIIRDFYKIDNFKVYILGFESFKPNVITYLIE